MNQITPQPLSSAVLFGSNSRKIAHDLLSKLSMQGEDIHVFDCAIRFDVFSITRATKENRFEALHNIKIQRAFTPYQLLDSISLLTTQPIDPESFPLIVFLSPAKQFFDPDVKQKEREHLLTTLISKFQQLRAKGFRFLIVESMRKESPLYLSFIDKLEKSFGTIDKPAPKKELADGQNGHTLFPNPQA
ncbi:hypothetical protein [Leptospira sp. id769339]|uniref:hypothetical protein n=1 Tax=Leptospira sp. id769339 TaxID=2864221 RepID=UPI00214B10EB|nr:hypothetical protein [Leptospira sp. id769339]